MRTCVKCDADLTDGIGVQIFVCDSSGYIHGPWDESLLCVSCGDKNQMTVDQWEALKERYTFEVRNPRGDWHFVMKGLTAEMVADIETGLARRYEIARRAMDPEYHRFTREG